MVRLRLTRKGAKKKPFYRVVASDARAPRDGRFIEQLGYYDPTRTPADINIKMEQLEAWIRKGANPSPTVLRLMKRAGWKGLQKETEPAPASAEG